MNTVRQGIFKVIKFHGSPKWLRFVILCGIIFLDFTLHTPKHMQYMLPVYWYLIYVDLVTVKTTVTLDSLPYGSILI